MKGQLSLWLLGSLALILWGCSSSDKNSSSERGLEPWQVDQTDFEDLEADDADNTQTSSGSHPAREVCDGIDNNKDGRVDEGLDGAGCTTISGERGTEACIAGKLRCQVCQPGAKRAEPCGCGLERTDVCGDDGIWRQGLCSDCDQPMPVPCGYCGVTDASGACLDPGECQPGDEMFRRCDDCPEDTGCGPASCVGEKWRCGPDCRWELVEGCQIRPSECDRDARLVAPCGQCGLSIRECDGCFWNRKNCVEQGACFPGDSRMAPCFAEDCPEGFGTTLDCNDDCEWIAADDCHGCAPGVDTEMIECVEGYPLCGIHELQYACVLQEPADECAPAIGVELEPSFVTDCPTIDCQPGQKQTQSCALADGTTGIQTRICDVDCTWPVDFEPCGVNNNTCVPGEQSVRQVDCGCGVTYTVTKTCRPDGLSWSKTTTGQEYCPECEPGEEYEQSCTKNGVCGIRTVSCADTCEWNLGECVPNPGACASGAIERRSCTHECGPGHETYTCIDCDWQLTGECTPDVTPECSPGEKRTIECNPVGCPQRQDTCNDACKWVDGNCPACG